MRLYGVEEELNEFSCERRRSENRKKISINDSRLREMLGADDRRLEAGQRIVGWSGHRDMEMRMYREKSLQGGGRRGFFCLVCS